VCAHIRPFLGQDRGLSIHRQIHREQQEDRVGLGLEGGTRYIARALMVHDERNFLHDFTGNFFYNVEYILITRFTCNFLPLREVPYTAIAIYFLT
jgi:hypothetical protein